MEHDWLMSQQQHYQQHLNELTELHKRNLARNVAKQLHLQRQYKANLPPVPPPPKKNELEEEDTAEDKDEAAKVPERKKKKKKDQKSQSGLGGDMKFKQEEVEYLMDCMEDILPMGKVEWEHLTERYNRCFPSRQRKMVNLRNQYNTYAKMKPPTGNPDWDPKKLANCNIPTMNGSIQDAAGIAATLSMDPKKVVSSKKKKKKKSNNLDTDSFVEVLLASEKVQAQREERMERRQQNERNQTLKLAITAMTSIAAAVTGREVPTVTAMPAAAKKRLIGSTSSSSDSDESPGTRRRHFKGRLKKYYKKRTSIEVTTKEGDNGNDRDSSTSEHFRTMNNSRKQVGK
jgi:hypothetical protein